MAGFSRLFKGRSEAADRGDAAAIAIAPVIPRHAGTPAGGGRTAPPGRRDRAVDDGHRQLRDGIAQKVLHGWLQNRHQTLYPLTVNLRLLSEAQQWALANWMAVALLAGQAPGDTGIQEAGKWLASVGADAATLAALTAAVARPPALNKTISSLIEHSVGPYAYVVALIALDPADAATLPFLDYVAIRLNLPTTVVRSATRRYRR